MMHKTKKEFRELSILKMMGDNPYVNHIEKEFEDESNFYMVFTYHHNGTLESLIDTRKSLPVEVVRCYTA